MQIDVKIACYFLNNYARDYYRSKRKPNSHWIDVTNILQ